MKFTRFLLLTLLPMLAGCAASVPAYVATPLTNAPTSVTKVLGSKQKEKTIRVTGYVLDSLSRKPVAGVFVGAAEWGNYFGQLQTDSKGHFILHLPISRRQTNQWIIVQTVLYEGRAAIPADTAREITILLHRNKHQLPPDECAGLADSLRMAPFAALITPFPGTRLAFFIAGNPQQTAGKIRTIGLDLEKIGMKDEEFWLRIYQAKGFSHSPGDVLMHEGRQFIDFHRTAGQQWIDLIEYNVSIPAEGILVELEVMVGCDACWGFSTLPNYKPTGLLLSPPCKLAEAHNWVQLFKPGWRPLAPAENPVPLYHQAIQVELVSQK